MEAGIYGGTEKEGGRNVRRGREVYRVTNLWNTDSRGGERERNMGKQREGKKGKMLTRTRKF